MGDDIDQVTNTMAHIGITSPATATTETSTPASHLSIDPSASPSIPSSLTTPSISSIVQLDPNAEPTKLFIGQVPRHITEDDLRKLFAPYGYILELSILRDKHTHAHRGCAFLVFSTHASAMSAIAHVHEKLSLHNRPIVVRLAGSAHAPVECKLFVGMLSRNTDDTAVHSLFSQYGTVKEVYLMRDSNQISKGCAFVKMSERSEGVAAINALNDIYQDDTAPRKLVVRFADTKAQKVTAAAQALNLSQQQAQHTITSITTLNHGHLVGAPHQHQHQQQLHQQQPIQHITHPQQHSQLHSHHHAQPGTQHHSSTHHPQYNSAAAVQQAAVHAAQQQVQSLSAGGMNQHHQHHVTSPHLASLTAAAAWNMNAGMNANMYGLAAAAHHQQQQQAAAQQHAFASISPTNAQRNAAKSSRRRSNQSHHQTFQPSTDYSAYAGYYNPAMLSYSGLSPAFTSFDPVSPIHAATPTPLSLASPTLQSSNPNVNVMNLHRANSAQQAAHAAAAANLLSYDRLLQAATTVTPTTGTLLISNLPESLTETDVSGLCGPYGGTVLQVRIIRDQSGASVASHTNSGVYGIVSMDTLQAAEKVTENLNGLMLGSNRLRVEISPPQQVVPAAPVVTAPHHLLTRQLSPLQHYYNQLYQSSPTHAAGATTGVTASPYTSANYSHLAQQQQAQQYQQLVATATIATLAASTANNTVSGATASKMATTSITPPLNQS